MENNMILGLGEAHGKHVCRSYIEPLGPLKLRILLSNLTGFIDVLKLQQHVFECDFVQGEAGPGSSSDASLWSSPIRTVCSCRQLSWPASGSLWSSDWWIRCCNSNERGSYWGRNHFKHRLHFCKLADFLYEYDLKSIFLQCICNIRMDIMFPYSSKFNF